MHFSTASSERSASATLSNHHQSGGAHPSGWVLLNRFHIYFFAQKIANSLPSGKKAELFDHSFL
jgi:hypothetical protein